LQYAFKGDKATDFSAIQLYTSLGELAPVRPPCSSVVAQAGGHMFLIPDEDRYSLWPSKPLERGRGPEWDPTTILPAPSESGGIVSVAAQGDRLLVLCALGVYELYVGSGGPDANGNGAFSPMRLAHAGDGCISHAGTVSTPVGVFYLAESGVKLVQGGGNVSDVGDPISESLVPRAVYAATYHDGDNEVWFVQEDGIQTPRPTCVFNLDTQGWSTFVQDTLQVLFANGDMHRLLSDGTVRKEDPSLGSDLASVYEGAVETPWIAPATPVGFVRVPRVGILVRLESGTQGRVTVSLSYDYVESVVDTFTFDYADFATFGRSTTFSVGPSRQKFDAIKIAVQDDTESEGSPGAKISDLVWSLAGVDLAVRTKTGVVKLEAGAKK